MVWNLLTRDVQWVLGSSPPASSSFPVAAASFGHASRVLDVVFNEASTRLFSCGEDKQIMEWNLENGQLIQ